MENYPLIHAFNSNQNAEDNSVAGETPGIHEATRVVSTIPVEQSNRTNRFILIRAKEDDNLACVFDLFSGKAMVTQYVTWHYHLSHIYQEE